MFVEWLGLAAGSPSVRTERVVYVTEEPTNLVPTGLLGGAERIRNPDPLIL